MTMYERLQVIAKAENIIAGVGRAEPFYELKERLKGRIVPFVSSSLEERTEPSVTMAEVRSLVAVGLPYNVVYDNIDDGKYRGVISAGAVGEDYHRIVMRKLEVIRNELLKDSSVMMYTDTGPLADREVALRCGLGVCGKNLSIINDDIGGMFFIGYMLTDIDYEKWNSPVPSEKKDKCKDCRKCISACPGNALENGKCLYKKCISYITQKKGVLSREECAAMGIQIYGCDICQRVCPYNKDFTRAYSQYAYPDTEELLTMTNRDFDRVYRHTAAGWRGKRILQRNALIALGNMKAVKMKDTIEKFTKDDREDIRAAAEYALEKIEED